MKKNWERGVGWGQRRVSNWRPRVSLAGGSLMVLFTLWMTIAVDACGPERTGYEFLVLGEGNWPSLMGIFSVTGGRIFYAAGLILAALTLLLLAFSVVSKRVWERKSLLRFFLILSGTLSLFFIADLLALFLWF